MNYVTFDIIDLVTVKSQLNFVYISSKLYTSEMNKVTSTVW